ncbi:zinc finger protein CONSTANS-LIKE 16 [Olea europaea var. sylvestris]|uniref:zinc finger protein CONSTANS-LIKE 16 n=1 Tax=Olea europaea var. sylvestris TaxID=158386 RepID=UPI000C1CF217|nr:zinc finger protein CONSTANS-LIKE 16 [Olea europaea var. sylvestris]
MVSDRKLANAVGGKTARACDNCIRKRARLYCAADDAFLCQSCDASVHSANPLARRHERVRLKISSIKSFDESSLQISVPSWHQGFTRKARTPRQKRHAEKLKTEEQIRYPLHLVPEICSEEHSNEENDEQLLYRVPNFDPFVAKLGTSANENVMNNDAENTEAAGSTESKSMPNDLSQDMNHLHGFLPSEMDLAEFAADVESLLGKGLEDESFDIEGLGILSREKDHHDSKECSLGSSEKVKVEDEEVTETVMAQAHENGAKIDLERETFEFNFDYDDYSPNTGEGEDVKAPIIGDDQAIIKKFEDFNEVVDDTDKKKKKTIMLSLDYVNVMSAWDEQRSPWTTGERPELNFNECWPECMGSCGTMHDMGMMSGHAAAMVDGGREARVSRYRAKRRTRLFSKKIRYEVRKLNAEKRPRMKGRFVKGANFVATAIPLLKK